MSMIINSRSDLEALRGNAVYAEALRSILGATTTWVNEAAEGEAPKWKRISVGDTLAHLELTLDELLAECAAAGIVPTDAAAPVSITVEPAVPASVPLWAVRSILRKKGLLDQANAAIAASDNEDIKDIWEYGNYVDRNSPALASLATALGIVDQLDEMFFAADKLKV